MHVEPDTFWAQFLSNFNLKTTGLRSKKRRKSTWRRRRTYRNPRRPRTGSRSCVSRTRTRWFRTTCRGPSPSWSQDTTLWFWFAFKFLFVFLFFTESSSCFSTNQSAGEYETEPDISRQNRGGSGRGRRRDIHSQPDTGTLDLVSYFCRDGPRKM